MTLRYGSVCSGIEAASVAWEPLGWQPQWFAEIDPFPSAVLAARWPTVPNLGDFTTIGDRHAPVELLVGGTPCQSFSVAGFRGGMADERGNLALEFCRLAARMRPRWVVWENVVGVLSSNRGRDFGSILGALAQLGYGWAYRVLDAQYYGVPQRRRRVFLVGCLGDWRGAAAVLFERHSLSGDLAPRREAGTHNTTALTAGFGSGGPDLAHAQAGYLVPGVALTLNGRIGARQDASVETMVPVAFDWQASVSNGKGAGRSRVEIMRSGDFAGSVKPRRQDAVLLGDELPAGLAVRRLTPRECERLQGFPDDFTLITYRRKPAADRPRYKALGNSMAVPCMAALGRRLAVVDALLAGARGGGA